VRAMEKWRGKFTILWTWTDGTWKVVQFCSDAERDTA
jgi:hypothetical protein